MGSLRESTMKYSYNDVMIKPAVLSIIRHRAECNPYDENGMLPLFTAPMDTVVSKDNFESFKENGIIPILPRTESLEDRIDYACDGKWAAFSLEEFENEFTKGEVVTANNIKALIDIANGHVTILYELVRKAKSIYKDNIQIMVGNIANPDTYRVCVESGVDFCRVGVGGGCGCLSTSNIGVHYPIASLVSEIADIKKELLERGVKEEKLTKIIADGGVRNYSDIIKSLVLGADYVMVGSVFARMLESAAVKTFNNNCSTGKALNLRVPLERYKSFKYENGYWTGEYTDEFVEKMKNKGREITDRHKEIGQISARFYGMASRAGQIAMKGKKVHTSEGLEKSLPVTYTMQGWVENFTDYIRSAMSYTNSRTLDELRESDVVLVSMNTYNSVNK